MKDFSLLRSTRSSIPEAAVLLTDVEVLNIQGKCIYNWKPRRETFFLRNAPFIAGGAAGLASIFITRHYRQALKLRRYGEIMSYMPAIVLPAILASILQKKYITNDIIVMRTGCSVCLDLKALTLQAVTGTVHPIIIGTISSFAFSNIYFTYRLPSVVDAAGRKTLIKIWYTLTKPYFSILSLIFGAHVLLALFITKMEVREYQNMLLKQHSY